VAFIQEELQEHGQQVRRTIIAANDDSRIRRGLVMTKNVDFDRYESSFSTALGRLPWRWASTGRCRPVVASSR
jgi:hypothetical protein